MGALDNVAYPIVEHCRFNNQRLDMFEFNDKGLDNFYLTTIVTMVDNDFMIFD